jgi:hypothetical protein
MPSIASPPPLGRILAATLVGLLVAGCAFDDRPLYRCLDLIGTSSLEISDLPPPKDMRVTTFSGSQSFSNFVIEVEAERDLDEPARVLADLCERLESQLAQRCEVRRSTADPLQCSFLVGSPQTATTGPDGVTHHRRMQGGVVLRAQPAADGRTRLLLTGSESPG